MKMQERQDKSFCYYCRENFEPGHKCKKDQIYLLVGDNNEQEVPDMSTSDVDDNNDPVGPIYP